MYIHHNIIFFYLIAQFATSTIALKFNLLKHPENIKVNNTKDQNLIIIPLKDFQLFTNSNVSNITNSNVSSVTNSTNENELKAEAYTDPTDFMIETVFQIKSKKSKYPRDLNILNLYDKNQTKRLEINFHLHKRGVNLVINDLQSKNHTELTIPRNKWNKLNIGFKGNDTVSYWMNCALNSSNLSMPYSVFPISGVSGNLFSDDYWKKNLIKIQSFEIQSDHILNNTNMGNCTDLNNLNENRYRREFENALSPLKLFDPIKLFDSNIFDFYKPLENEFEKLLTATANQQNESGPIVIYEWNFSTVF